MGNGAEGAYTGPTLRLLRLISSPFVTDRALSTLPVNRRGALELLDYAEKNKIKLLYLHTLEMEGKLEEFGLGSIYQEERNKLTEQLGTAIRISDLFISSHVNHAIFKSIMPFPAVLNDVDILHFGSDRELERAAGILRSSGFMEYNPVNADSRQLGFHDMRGGFLYPHPREKDVYDVDLYQEAAASYLIYLDKSKLAKYVVETDVMGNHLRILKPSAELVAMITHSIIPEQLLTLLAYYATLHHLSRMDSKEITEFVALVRENHVVFPIGTHFSLVADLHRAAHGSIPERVQKVLDDVGTNISEAEYLEVSNFRTPHRYSLSAVIGTLLEKAKESSFRRSLPIQVLHLLDMRMARYVISEVVLRRRRETY